VGSRGCGAHVDVNVGLGWGWGGAVGLCVGWRVPLVWVWVWESSEGETGFQGCKYGCEGSTAGRYAGQRGSVGHVPHPRLRVSDAGHVVLLRWCSTATISRRSRRRRRREFAGPRPRGDGEEQARQWHETGKWGNVCADGDLLVIERGVWRLAQA
jgi:hypothetical protein